MYTGRLRASVLALIERLYSTADILRQAHEHERGTIIVPISIQRAIHVAGRLEWAAKWLTRVLPILVKHAGRQTEGFDSDYR